MTQAVTEYILPSDIQSANEYKYNRKQINKAIETYLLSSHRCTLLIKKSVKGLEKWLAAEYYPSKQKRLNQVKELDLYELVTSIAVGLAYCQTPELFVSVTSKLARKLGFNNRKEGILTMAEIVTVMAQNDMCDIYRNDYELEDEHVLSFVIKATFPLSRSVINFIDNCTFIPPMVAEPKKLTANHESAYYTFNESVILQRDNHHEDYIALDIINKQNRIPLRINEEFVNTVAEEPTFELDTPQKIRDWTNFLNQSKKMYQLVHEQADCIFEPHYYDKRGRMYVKGYQINSMGSPYKKAMLDLADEETIEIPEEYK